jgi:fructokinase
VVEPIASTLRALVERAHGTTLVAYDPNVRLNVVPEVGPWRDMLEWMLPSTDLLKISDEDLHLLLPGRSGADFAASALERGVELVVVTRGGAGAEAWTRQAHAAVAATPVEVVDSVGAGDTFQAALLTWLAEEGALSPDGLRGLSGTALAAALGFAGLAASITCSRRGADLPRRGELP